MMDERRPPSSCILEGKDMNAYPIYFGVSCAFAALQLISCGNPNLDETPWSSIMDSILQGSAHLLGLLVWKAQGGEAMEGRLELLNKLKKAEQEVLELKKRRSEDAKANEKVMSIFASQEQNWISERKRLRQHIQALLNHLQVLERKKEETISNLNKKIAEKETILESKVKAFDEEEKRGKDLEERLQVAEAAAEELRDRAKKEAQDHSSELWKHKTAFIELVSNQRQLEAEMGRALRQVEAMKQELDAVYEQKEESDAAVQSLSAEIAKMQKDNEQKDKILSAMLRKSKSDTMEKQILLKEIKISKARRKQAELETERWRARCESRLDKMRKSNSVFRADSWSEAKGMQSIEAESSQYQRQELQTVNSSCSVTRTPLHDYLESEHRKELECVSPVRVTDTALECSSQFPAEANGELVITANAKQLEDWVQLETERYISILEQRHFTEIDAFAEQMRLKDEKLEAFRWRLLSMERESKRLQSHIEGIDEDLSQIRKEYMKLEAILIDRENELQSLKDKFNLQSRHVRKNISIYCPDHSEVPDGVWSELTILKQKQGEIQRELRAEDEIQTITDQKEPLEPEPLQIQNNNESSDIDKVMVSELADSVLPLDLVKEEKVVGTCKQAEQQFDGRQDRIEGLLHERVIATEIVKEEIEEERELGVDLGQVREKEKLVPAGKCLTKKNSPWKMDLHALGVSYKIKRLKQQLQLLEKLSVKQAVEKPARIDHNVDVPKSHETSNIEDGQHLKGMMQVLSLLNKQVKRYQSLEEKTNDLCKRMHESDHDGTARKSSVGKTKVQMGTLEHFLEETFQLQRYMVATGQKLMEIQSRIAYVSVSNSELGETMGLDVRQFSDRIKTLFREIQRGLEVRISRIIGDLEGTLACEGIMNFKK